MERIVRQSRSRNYTSPGAGAPWPQRPEEPAESPKGPWARLRWRGPSSKALVAQGRVLFLLATGAIFTLVGVAAPFINARVNDRIERSSRFEPSLNMTQIKTSVARLSAAAAQYRIDPSREDALALRIALAVVQGWAHDISVGELGAVVASHPKISADAKEFQRRAAELERLASEPDRPEFAGEVKDTIRSLDAPLNRLSAAVLRESSRLNERDQRAMTLAQRVQLAMLIGVVGSGVALFVFISRQNARLHRLHDEQEALAAQFERLAKYDPLTGLLNRGGFKPLVEAACASAERDGDETALLMLDLDMFKSVNDAFGHAVGDELLKSTAARMASPQNGAVRMTLSRLGGDEFAALIVGPNARARAMAAGPDIIARIREPHHLGRLALATDASIGLAFAPEHGTHAEDLMLAADIALYRAKAAGRGGVQVYKQSDGGADLGRRQLETHLVEALENGEFEPFYQPQIDFRTGRVVALEALLRWRRADTIVSPMEFVPFAEATGLMVDIDRALLTQVCVDLTRIPEALKVSVNMSVAQLFCGDLVEAIFARLAAAGASARRLEVEITETMFMTNASRTSKVMARLQEAGVSIALDDFGSGYSSLGYLRRFRFDKLKIDKMFLDSVAPDPQAVEILRTIAALGRALEQTVVAEGVETPLQAEIAELVGCSLGQGFLYAAPAPLEDILRIVAERNGDPASLGRVA